jgi:NAD(P)-dependent dehydrogenase (short-subunit alcohol dehydrogenase family)
MENTVYECINGAKLLKGKTAIITGGASGIGAAIVRMFSYQGARTIIVDLDKSSAEKIESKINSDGGIAISVEADITREKDIEELFRIVTDQLGTLDILVNNAGGGLPTKFQEIDIEEWNRIMSINLTATFRLSQCAARILCNKGGGAIVNISSIAGRSSSLTAGCHYTASKAGVLGLTRHLARELAPFSIRVNAVCPGVVNTKRIVERIDALQTMNQICSSIPLGRIGDVDEVAGCCLFLASGLSNFVTGAIIDVNGGALMI